MQFLIESAILCALGGIIGLLMAWGITTLITTLASITMTITIGYIIAGADRVDRDRHDRGHLSGVQSRATRSDSGPDASNVS